MFTDAFLHLNRPELSADFGPSTASCVCPRHPWCWIPCPGVSCGRAWDVRASLPPRGISRRKRDVVVLH
eukprot:176007-Chlamydomonas_euryale.AAC.1